MCRKDEELDRIRGDSRCVSLLLRELAWLVGVNAGYWRSWLVEFGLEGNEVEKSIGASADAEKDQQSVAQ